MGVFFVLISILSKSICFWRTLLDCWNLVYQSIYEDYCLHKSFFILDLRFFCRLRSTIYAIASITPRFTILTSSCLAFPKWLVLHLHHLIILSVKLLVRTLRKIIMAYHYWCYSFSSSWWQ